MPKTPKNKSANKNKTSKNRSLHKALKGDKIFQAMMNGKLEWGNIALNAENKPKRLSINWSPNKNTPPNTAEERALYNWKTPDLALRKGIWENFPVILDRLEDRDGTERYAVKWHEKHLKDWENTMPEQWADYYEYKTFAEFRLFHALRKYSHKYRLMPAELPGQIAVLEMVHAEGAPKKAPHPVGVPVLRKLNDIKEHFPVVWHPVDGKAGKSTYALELFGKKLKEISKAVGHDVTGEVSTQLGRALDASHAWKVLPAVGKEFCRLEIA